MPVKDRATKTLKDLLATSERLRRSALSTKDISIIKRTFNSLWKEKDRDWRQMESCKRFHQIRHLNSHLFLVCAIVISHTAIASSEIGRLVKQLATMNDFDEYRFQLRENDCEILKVDARECGYDCSEFRAVLDNIRQPIPAQGDTLAEFQSPPTQEVTQPQIQFSFTQMPEGLLDTMPDLLKNGLKSSQLYAKEREDGSSTTSVMTLFLRPHGQDGSLVLTLGSSYIHELRLALDMSLGET